MKAVIYCRKSTDRDDKQANSLEHQIANCRTTAERLGLEVVREYQESASAKNEFKRPMFNEMVELLQKGKIDFLIVDEPKRISRNNIDTSRIIDLLDKKRVKGIYATSREYRSDNSRDKFLLQLDLSLSKMDNEDRSKDIRDKMITCAKKGMCLTKAPFGYLNVTLSKNKKTVRVVPKEAEVVKKVFEWRTKDRLSYEEISIKATRMAGVRINRQRVEKMLANRFYCGDITFSGETYPGIHQPLVSREIFNAAFQSPRFHGFYVRKEENRDKSGLKGLLKDEKGHLLAGYVTKGRVYYKNQNHVSNATVNIPEARVLEKAAEYFRNLPDSSAFTEAHSRAFERALLAHEATLEPKRRELEKDLRAKERTKADLLELLLDGTLDKATYRKKLSEIDTVIENAKAEIAKIDRFDRSKIKKLKNRIIELGNPLREAYERGSAQLRCAMLKNAFIELSVTTKKELRYGENELFSCLKCAFVSDGGPKETRTPDLFHAMEAF